MRILITNVSFYPAHEGGPTNALYWLASGLSHSGFDVSVVTTGRGITEANFVYDAWHRLNGFNVIYVKNEDWKNTIKKELQKSDAYIACGVCTLWGFYIRMIAVLKGKRVVISPRGELFNTAIDHKGRLFGLLKRVFFQIMRICYGEKVVYHVTSDEEEMVVKKRMKTEKVFNIPNLMILPERILPDEDIQPYFLYVGRINPIKALDKLIQALSMSQAFVQSKYTLKIAGEATGSYYNELIHLIDTMRLENKVEFLGVVSGDNLNKLYANAQWLFLVSDSENFGNVVIESLSQSTPVIASTGTPWEILTNYKAGFWVNNTPDSLSEVINRIIGMNLQEYKDIRDNAHHLSRTYDIYSNMDKWLHVLQNE